jgi:hypothetical protein
MMNETLTAIEHKLGNLDQWTTVDWMNFVAWDVFILAYIAVAIFKHRLWWKMIVGGNGIPQVIEGAAAVFFLMVPFLAFTIGSLQLWNKPIEEWLAWSVWIGGASVLGKTAEKTAREISINRNASKTTDESIK